MFVTVGIHLAKSLRQFLVRSRFFPADLRIAVFIKKSRADFILDIWHYWRRRAYLRRKQTPIKLDRLSVASRRLCVSSDDQTP